MKAGIIKPMNGPSKNIPGTQRYSFKKILVEREAAQIELTETILREFPNADVEICSADGREKLARSLEEHPSEVLFLARKRGRFVKPFPDHPWYGRRGKTCNFNLIIGYNCIASCAYCFNKSYFKDPFPTLFVNTRDMLDELRGFLADNSRAILSTGEFTDSFFLDSITRTNEKIMDVLAEFPGAALELRTKFDAAKHMPHPPKGKILAAWSLNPPRVIETLERGTPPLEARLEAAKELLSMGYSIAFRMDPMVMTGRFDGAYKALAEQVENLLGWNNVSRVFVGAFRFNRSFLRSPAKNPSLFDAQYVRCPDGKYRADKFTRIRFYKLLVDSIRTHAPHLRVDLTMEPEYVWKEVFRT